MKQFKFPIRDSGLNPFISNPIHAVVPVNGCLYSLKTFYIQHCVKNGTDLLVFGTYHNETKYTKLNLSQSENGIRIANLHEASRFEQMLKMLRIEL